MPEIHAEPYLVLAAVTHKAALIAWGGFYFRVRGHSGDAHKLIDDSDLDHVHPARKDTIGSRSEPYGTAVVEIFDGAGRRVAFAETCSANHTWVAGLAPDTDYSYRVTINGEEWGRGERRDWIAQEGRQGLFAAGRSYDNRFRTHPAPDAIAPVTFAVIGDFGTGIRKPSTSKRRQREVARTLEWLVAQKGARLVLTTGDNIYAGRDVLGIPIGATGDEDDDWFFTYYQPYRYVLNRVPVYPAVGNHDSSETEASDDRQQLLDNFHLTERFASEENAGRASIGPGLFYRFPFGADVEFVCVDSSRQSLLFGKRFYQHPNHAAFLETAFPAPPAPRWRIPFMHHPVYCAGPQHGNSKSGREYLEPRFLRSGVRAVFAGHEHNFQLSVHEGVHHFTTGAAGKVRTGVPGPGAFAEAYTTAWAATAHCLLVEVAGDVMRVTAYAGLDDGAAGDPQPIAVTAPDGRVLPGTFEIRHA